MRAHALSGNTGAAEAHYALCLQTLQDELGEEPAAETQALLAAIQQGTIEDPRSLAEVAVQFPPFLEKGVDPPPPVFVAREAELARLAIQLEKALTGEGQVAFVVGGAGRGKSALLAALARQSMAIQSDLVVAAGSGSAFAGIGDPFLPFRDVLGLLAGDVAQPVASGAISLEQARRLWGSILITCQAMVLHGPHLPDLLVSQADLIERAQTAVPPRLIKLAQLKKLARPQETSIDLKQEFLFQQITNVLKFISERLPLLILLDDLQWADATSISLLFHLARRLRNSRVCIVGAYRPEEVALGRGGERHPLEKVLAEIKREYGDVLIDLGQTDEAESRRFVATYLDSELNDLEQAFRDALYEHTGGHPLFTVELLRAMQERGDLVRGKNGRWIITETLNWQQMPSRVEAVIEERISRLEDELRELLTIASVDGEEFTAQVVARVQNINERHLLRQLSQALVRKHRLVREQGDIELGQTILSRYRFTHALFQKYLYDELSTGERRLLHQDVADVLESLYSENANEIAIQLAHHYELANNRVKAPDYLQRAGEQAAMRYANDEALDYFARALKLIPGNAYSKRYDLHLTREKILTRVGMLKPRREELNRLQENASLLNDDKKRAEVALREVDFAFVAADYNQMLANAKIAIQYAKAGQAIHFEAEGYFRWGHALSVSGPFDLAKEKLMQAISLAQQENQKETEAYSYNVMGIVCAKQGEVEKAKTFFEYSHQIFKEELKNDAEAARIMSNLGVIALLQQNYTVANKYIYKVLQTHRQVGNRRSEGIALGSLSQYHQKLGDYFKAKKYLEQALTIFEELTARSDFLINFQNLGLIYHLLGHNDQALMYGQQSIEFSQEYGDLSSKAFGYFICGLACSSLERYGEAIDSFRKSIAIRRELNEYSFLIEALAGLAETYMAQDNPSSAYTCVQEILSLLDNHAIHSTHEPYRIYLTCYRVLLANEDPRAQEILEQAYEELQETAAKITDKRLRRSFLNNVVAVRELRRVYES